MLEDIKLEELSSYKLGKKEGKEEGKAEDRLETAVRMLRKGLSPELVSEITELEMSQVLQLQRDLPATT